MSPELMVLRFIQYVILINTFVLAFSAYQAYKKKLRLHRILSGIALSTTLAGVLLLVITLFAGFEYGEMTSGKNLFIHRSFSVPLFLLLCFVAFFGIKQNRKMHLRFIIIMLPFWFGTLITGFLFF